MHSDGSVWVRNSTSWTKLDDNIKTKAITANGNVYQWRSDGSVWAYAGKGLHSWTELDANAATIKLSTTYAHL
ncbi:hypothetical protein [Ktedonospora formicarum]|uniref:Uncharacterized protein n=1 Tax=Ktedonospora formicarum TaxID=2778364 RepID=A0A8J3I347_9CHLR|nr:hypothetical protein [Ktedonospora formicarum]GHO47901.1 hypothetical protein KSX_60640 [Ktedonospora formicarum]